MKKGWVTPQPDEWFEKWLAENQKERTRTMDTNLAPSITLEVEDYGLKASNKD